MTQEETAKINKINPSTTIFPPFGYLVIISLLFYL
jgi:hypothetical protein